MKFSTHPVKAVVKPAFDVNAAIESLTDSLEQVGQSYDAVVAAEGRMIEAEQVLSDCHTALESLKKFGVSVENMALLNEGNALDQALGMENLALESIASLSASTKSALQSQYIAGLEANASEVVKAMAQKVKDFFVKVWQWLKDFFTGNAKIVKIVQEVILADKVGELDPEKKIVAYKYDDMKAAVEVLDKAYQSLIHDATPPVENVEQIVMTAEKTTAPEFTKENKTVKELGWDNGKLKEIAAKFNVLGTKKDVAELWKKLDATYKSGEKPESIKILGAARKMTAVYGKMVRQIGLTLITVAKAGKKAAPAAAAK